MKIIYRIYKAKYDNKAELIKIAGKEGLHIVCKDKKEAEKIYREAQRMGFNDLPYPLTFKEFVWGEFFGVMIKGFVIDDVDLLIKYLARGVPVRAICINTIVGESNENKKVASCYLC